MARNIHWKVSFRTRSEKLGVLNLYEENYTGAVVELTPAAVPFETQEDSSDTWFVPIRKQTGYIRVLDEGNTDGIMPVGMKDRYVEYTEDGALKWCGYMVPDVFSSDWDVTPNEVEFPVVGGLGVLEGLYLDENKGLNVVPLANLLWECVQATGIDYNRIYVPKEVTFNSTNNDYLCPLKVELSRFNFFRENDSLNSEDEDWKRYNGETLYDVLSEIVKFWGWTIRERGNDLWITSVVNRGSVYITRNQLEDLANGVSVEVFEKDCTTHDLSDFELAGSDHKKDVLQGRKKIVVKSEINPVGVVVPSIDKDKMRLVGSDLLEHKVDGNVYYYDKWKLYSPKSGYNDVELKSYAKQTMTEVFDAWNPIAQSLEAISLYVGAYFVSHERVEGEDYEKKKNWNLTDGIKINLEDFAGNYPSVSEAASLPIIIMKSQKMANYTSGAFVISATTWSRTHDGAMVETEGNGKGIIAMQFRVGDMYWNGFGWGKPISRFGVEIGNEENPEATEGKGKIISTKTLEQPYTGADGYVMPINQPLSGEVELIIHAVRNDGGYYTLMLENFRVEYFGEDDEEKKRDDSTNRYAKMTGLNSKDEEEIALSMATDNDNKSGYGILSHGGVSVSNLYFLNNGTKRPEMNLVDKGVSMYKRNTEKLTLNLESKEMDPQDLITRKGKKYAIASEAVNWQEETAQYIIMEV